MTRLRLDARYIRYLMQQRGIVSLRDLSAASDVHVNTLTVVMRGGRWRPGTVERLADVLGCDPTELITSKEPEPTP